jgi:hypothetical protein
MVHYDGGMNDHGAARGVRMRTLRVVLVLLALAAGLHDLSRSAYFPLQHSVLDLRVFYCGGRVASAGGDPYAIEPLRSCEHAVPNALLRRSPNLVLPYVLPGYDLPPLEALARLPFDAGVTLFAACALAALAGSIALIARATGIDALTTTAALAIAFSFPGIVFGQTACFELLALAATGWALARGHDRWAGVLAATTAVEPHVGLFTVVAVGALVPRARLTLAAALAVFGAVAVAATSVPEQLFYLGRELGEHAYAEVRFDEQDSLAFALTLARVPDRVALAIGALSTLVLLIAAIPFSRTCARFGRREAIAFLPAAFSVTGGTFVHLTQEPLAIPAALVLLRLARTRTAALLAGSAVVLLAVPWPFVAAQKQLLVLSLLCAGITTWYVSRRAWRPTLATVAACATLLWFLENHLPRDEGVPQVPRFPPGTPVDVAWRAATDQMSAHDPARVALKIPTWAGLLAIVGAAASLRTRSPREPAPQAGAS